MPLGTQRFGIGGSAWLLLLDENIRSTVGLLLREAKTRKLSVVISLCGDTPSRDFPIRLSRGYWSLVEADEEVVRQFHFFFPAPVSVVLMMLRFLELPVAKNRQVDMNHNIGTIRDKVSSFRRVSSRISSPPGECERHHIIFRKTKAIATSFIHSEKAKGSHRKFVAPLLMGDLRSNRNYADWGLGWLRQVKNDHQQIDKQFPKQRLRWLPSPSCQLGSRVSRRQPTSLDLPRLA